MVAQGKHVLLAEDNLAMAGVVRFNLERAGLQVQVARCGHTAWGLLKEQTFDLAIVDVQMPGLNGTELCERIRLVPRLAGLPIILLTAKGFELDRRYHEEQLRVRAIVTKPFSPRELLHLVEECLGMGAAGMTADGPRGMVAEGPRGMTAAGS